MGILPSSWFEGKSAYVVWMGEYHSLLLKGNSVARILWKLNVYFLCQNTFYVFPLVLKFLSSTATSNVQCLPKVVGTPVQF